MKIDWAGSETDRVGQTYAELVTSGSHLVVCLSVPIDIAISTDLFLLAFGHYWLHLFLLWVNSLILVPGL